MIKVIKMKIKFRVCNDWKGLKTSLFIIDLFKISFNRMLNYYRISIALFGFEFMIELIFNEGDKK